MTSDEVDLHSELRDLYWRWKNDYKYNANRFIQKLENDGAIKTASDLVLSDEPSQGFKELQVRGLLHLTIEAVVLRPEYAILFPPEVAEAAKRKLRIAGAKFVENSV